MLIKQTVILKSPTFMVLAKLPKSYWRKVIKNENKLIEAAELRQLRVVSFGYSVNLLNFESYSFAFTSALRLYLKVQQKVLRWF